MDGSDPISITFQRRRRQKALPPSLREHVQGSRERLKNFNKRSTLGFGGKKLFATFEAPPLDGGFEWTAHTDTLQQRWMDLDKRTLTERGRKDEIITPALQRCTHLQLHSSIPLGIKSQRKNGTKVA